jgi:hypothetical protein
MANGDGRAICAARPAGMASVTVPTGHARQRHVWGVSSQEHSVLRRASRTEADRVATQ